MIDVVFRIELDTYHITAKGHALFDKKGKDLLCCAVSTLLQSFIVGLNQIGETIVDFKKDNGYLKIDVKKINDKTRLLLDFIFINLKVIENEHSTHIKITLEEPYGRS